MRISETSTLDVLGDLHRQRLDGQLARHLREHPALLAAGRLADERDVDRRLDRLVEPDLVQVDVRDVSAHDVLLVVLQDRRVRARPALDDDVEDRVQAARAGQRAPEVALLDGDRLRLAAAVQDAGDDPLPAQAPRLRGAEALARSDQQFDALSSHGGGL